MTIRKVYALCSQTCNPPGLVPPNLTKPGPFSGTVLILRMPQPQKNKNSLRTGKNCHRLHATGMSFMYVCCKQINQLYLIWTTTTNTCITCNKWYDENHEHGPNRVSSGRAFRKTVSSSMQALRAVDGMPSSYCDCSVAMPENNSQMWSQQQSHSSYPCYTQLSSTQSHFGTSTINFASTSLDGLVASKYCAPLLFP